MAAIVSQTCLRASKVKSPAVAFLTIATGRNIHVSSTGLHFLVPRNLEAHRAPSAIFATALSRHARGVANDASPTQHPEIPSWGDSRRNMGRRTVAVHNPQSDEKGVPMSLEITEKAADRLHQIMRQDGNNDLALRVNVEGGGCIGFQYKMELVTLPARYRGGTTKADSLLEAAPTNNIPFSDPNMSPSSFRLVASAGAKTGLSKQVEQVMVDEEDTIFAPTDGFAKIIMNRVSLEVLKGSKIDFKSALIGSHFEVTENPRLKKACGCGSSFDIVDEM